MGIFDPPPVDVAQLLQGLGQAPAPPPEADAAIAQTIQDLLAQMQVLPTQPELVQPEPLGGLQKVLLSLAGAGNAFAAGVNPQIQQQDFLSPVLNRRQGAADRANLTNQRQFERTVGAQRAGLQAQIQDAIGRRSDARQDARLDKQIGAAKDAAKVAHDNLMKQMEAKQEDFMAALGQKLQAGQKEQDDQFSSKRLEEFQVDVLELTDGLELKISRASSPEEALREIDAAERRLRRRAAMQTHKDAERLTEIGLQEINRLRAQFAVTPQASGGRGGPLIVPSPLGPLDVSTGLGALAEGVGHAASVGFGNPLRSTILEAKRNAREDFE